ncbi:MAG: hypothetical protein K5682_05665 [Lachnospiraceae bacterium]|nr:hypothetical protein [Lachnospiraceae bacterium]
MNQQNVKLEETKRRCNTAANVLSVFKIFMILGAVLSFVSGILMFVYQSEINPYLEQSVAEGRVKIDALATDGAIRLLVDASGALEAGNYAIVVWINCMVATLICLVAMVVVMIFRSIFVKIQEEDSPFKQEVLQNMKRAFIIVTVASLFFVGFGVAVMVGLLLWCIYAIFEYGTELQNEVDETL